MKKKLKKTQNTRFSEKSGNIESLQKKSTTFLRLFDSKTITINIITGAASTVIVMTKELKERCIVAFGVHVGEKQTIQAEFKIQWTRK